MQFIKHHKTVPILLALAGELLTGCGRAPKPIESPQGSNQPPPATKQTYTPRTPLPIDFPPPKTPTGFVWLNPTKGGGFDEKSSTTLDHAASFLAALWKIEGDPRYHTLTNVSIVAASNRNNTNTLAGQNFGMWWSYSNQRIFVDTNSLAGEAERFFTPVVSLGHELTHAVTITNRTTSLKSYLMNEVIGCSGGQKTASSLSNYVSSLNVPGSLRAIWQTSIAGCMLHQRYFEQDSHVRIALLEVAESCSSLPPIPELNRNPTLARNLSAMGRAASNLAVNDTWNPADLALAKQIFIDTQNLGLEGPFVGFIPADAAFRGMRSLALLEELSVLRGQNGRRYTELLNQPH